LFKIILSTNDDNLAVALYGLFELASRMVTPNMQNGHDRAVNGTDRALLSPWLEPPDMLALTAEWGERLVVAEWEDDVPSPENATLTNEQPQSFSDIAGNKLPETKWLERNRSRALQRFSRPNYPLLLSIRPGDRYSIAYYIHSSRWLPATTTCTPWGCRYGIDGDYLLFASGRIARGVLSRRFHVQHHGRCRGLGGLLLYGIGRTLLVQAEIVRVERRKVMVHAKLFDPDQDNAVHATCEGVVVLNKGILHME
jgi:hypothetical protein